VRAGGRKTKIVKTLDQERRSEDQPGNNGEDACILIWEERERKDKRKKSWQEEMGRN